MENKLQGYICIFRSVKNHWIWKDPVKFQWWIDILLSVNYSKEIQKVNIGYELFECGRGQSVKTLNTWSKDWNVNKDTVRNFFKLLEKDHMITHENLIKCTRITVCNFDEYQTNLHDKQPTGKRKADAKQPIDDPNNKENKENKEITFDEFWNLYDLRKGSKEKIKAKWNNLTQEEKESIMLHIPKYKIEQPDKQFRKHPETYLNNKSWNDEVLLPAEKKVNTIETVTEFFRNEYKNFFKFWVQDSKEYPYYQKNKQMTEYYIGDIFKTLIKIYKSVPVFLESVEPLTAEQIFALVKLTYKHNTQEQLHEIISRIAEKGLLKFYKSVYACCEKEIQTA